MFGMTKIKIPTLDSQKTLDKSVSHRQVYYFEPRYTFICTFWRLQLLSVDIDLVQSHFMVNKEFV